MTSSPLSTSKPSSDLFKAPCYPEYSLFPQSLSPTDWYSCHDSYDYTWSLDYYTELKALDDLNKIKLIRSTGFCPQNRCQLANVANADFNGTCPQGLCYTKVENGSLSFGACCFRNGEFNSGQIIGFYFKSQPTPKPIYKKTRIVLGDVKGSSNDQSASFVNANEIHSNLIATQCPLAGRPDGYANTVNDVKRMIIEQNITFWVQLAPNNISAYYNNGLYTPGKGSCGVFPLEFFSNTSSEYSAGVSDFQVFGSTYNGSYLEMRYTLTAYVKELSDGKRLTQFTAPVTVTSALTSLEVQSHQRQRENFESVGAANDAADTHNNPKADVEDVSTTTSFSPSTTVEAASAPSTDSDTWLNGVRTSRSEVASATSGWTRVHVTVEHVWYHRWKDFKVPQTGDEKDIHSIATRAANRLEEGGSVAINCLSGRGRTGTFASIVLGIKYGYSTYTQLVDAIVDLRRHRDGLVETPAQFKYAALALQLSDPSYCGTSCTLANASAKATNSAFYIPFLSGFAVALLCLGAFFLFYTLRKQTWAKDTALFRAGKSDEKYAEMSDVAVTGVRRRRSYQSSENDTVAKI